MIIYNKVEDIFHTSRRIISILRASSHTQIPIKWVMLVDFLYCFPQYRTELCRKKGLKFLKPSEMSNFHGSKRSHLFVLEKSHRGAYKLLRAKNIIGIDGEFAHHLDRIEHFDQFDVPEIIAQIIKFLETNGLDPINKHIDIFESKYDASVKD